MKMPTTREVTVGYEIRTAYLDSSLWIVRSLDEVRALRRRGIPRGHIFTFMEAYFLLDAAQTPVFSMAEAMWELSSAAPEEA
jgi:hypothetical protein